MLALAASSQGLLFVQGAWVANQDWIAGTLCENRDRPELHCEGTCQLTKRLHEQERREEERRTVQVEVALSVTACLTACAEVSAPVARPPAAWTAGLARDTGTEADRGVFHPPRVG